MKRISYLESCNMFFAPLDEIMEAIENNEGLNGFSNAELKGMVSTNYDLSFYIDNFDEYVV